MRKGFLIYDEMRKYFPINEEAVSHIWLCDCSIFNFLIYEENLIFFFIFAYLLGPQMCGICGPPTFVVLIPFSVITSSEGPPRYWAVASYNYDYLHFLPISHFYRLDAKVHAFIEGRPRPFLYVGGDGLVTTGITYSNCVSLTPHSSVLGVSRAETHITT